jgi:hypothetical protein
MKKQKPASGPKVRCYLLDETVPADDPRRRAPGHMFYVDFSGGHCDTHTPPCTQHLYVVTPGGHWWDIDGRASNCTMKDDKQHRCWVRHGEPPNVTVDKAGLTCKAGAGSIKVDGYHGFLRNGEFT